MAGRSDRTLGGPGGEGGMGGREVSFKVSLVGRERGAGAPSRDAGGGLGAGTSGRTDGATTDDGRTRKESQDPGDVKARKLLEKRAHSAFRSKEYRKRKKDLLRQEEKKKRKKIRDEQRVLSAARIRPFDPRKNFVYDSTSSSSSDSDCDIIHDPGPSTSQLIQVADHPGKGFPNVWYLGSVAVSSKASNSVTSTGSGSLSDPKPPLTVGHQGSPEFETSVVNVVKWMNKKLKKTRAESIVSAAEALGVSEKTVRRIMDRRHSERKKRVKLTWRHFVDEFVLAGIRRIIHSFFLKGRAPTQREIYAKVTEKYNIFNFGNGKKHYGISTLKKILKHIEFTYCLRNNRDELLFARDKNVEKRFEFMRKLDQYRQEKRPLVFTDETWANTGMGPKRVIFDKRVARDPYLAMIPGNGLTFNLKGSSGAGERLIIVHSIMDNNGEYSFLPNCKLVYRSGRKTGDYHGDMNAESYERYISERVIPNMPDGGVLVVDNAPSHVRKLVTIPRRKSELVEFMVQKREEFFPDCSEAWIRDPLTTLKMLNERVSPYRRMLEIGALDELIKNAGRDLKLLRMPPYHCDLNPIEKLWADLKRFLRSNLDLNATSGKLAQLERLTNQYFDDLTICQPQTKLAGYFKFAQDAEVKFKKVDGNAPNVMAQLMLDLDGNVSSDSDSDSDSEFAR